MNFQQLDLTARDLLVGCHDDGGLVGYGGTLDIQPPLQRDFTNKGQQH